MNQLNFGRIKLDNLIIIIVKNFKWDQHVINLTKKEN